MLSEVANRMGISLTQTASKLLSSFILCRLYNTRKGQTRDEQAGFRGGRGWIDQISTPRQLF